MRTVNDKMPRARAGCLVNRAFNCPCAAFLLQAPNLVRTEIGDEHFVGELHNLRKRSPVRQLDEQGPGLEYYSYLMRVWSKLVG